MSKQPFASLTLKSLQAEIVSDGGKPFAARQVFEGVYRRNVRAFDAISNISRGLRSVLARRYDLRTLEVIRRADSPDGSFKLVLRLADGNVIECAYLAAGERGTACISSQVGCAMGCIFCASGQKGLVRDLEPFEMIEQVLLVRDRLIDLSAGREVPRGESRGSPAGAERLTNVTVMGIGEPLANLDNVLAALQIVNAPLGLNIGARKISISTCGLVKGIRRLADEEVQYHLAISLHAPTDKLRRRLMPAAARTPIAEILEAARYYTQRTGRKVVFEYVLIRDVNDSLDLADQLARLLGGLPCMVNLIPVNAVEHCPDLQPPAANQTGRFFTALKRSGIEAVLRQRKGADVAAACGQLRIQALGRH